MDYSAYDYTLENWEYLSKSEVVLEIRVAEDKLVQFNKKRIEGYIGTREVYSAETKTEFTYDFIKVAVLEAVYQLIYGESNFKEWLRHNTGKLGLALDKYNELS